MRDWKELTRGPETISPCLFFLFFVFTHCDYSLQAFSSAAIFFSLPLLLSLHLSIQSLHPFRLHSSFLLVFNLFFPPLALSILACSTLQCKHNLFWGEVNYWSCCCHSLCAEVGRRGRKDGREGGTRVDKRNGEDRLVQTTGREVFGVWRIREMWFCL